MFSLGKKTGWIKKITTNIIFASFILSLVLPSLSYAANQSVDPTTSANLDAQIQTLQQQIDQINKSIDDTSAKIEANSGYWGTFTNTISGGWDSIKSVFNSPWLSVGGPQAIGGKIGYDYFFGQTQKKWSQETASLQSDLEKYRQQLYAADLKIQELQAQKNGATQEELNQLQRKNQAELNTHAEQTATRLAASDQAERIRSQSCTLTNFSVFGCTLELIAMIGNLMASISSYLAYFANSIFNVAAKVSITDFYYFASMKAVGAAWGIVRDICNLFFIFVLLYIAIGTVLNSVIKIDTKAALVKIIIVALLVNFSAILPKVVIDISNIFTIPIYNEINTIGGGDFTTAIIKSLKLENVGVTLAQADPLGDFASGMGTVIISAFGKMILFLITAFVMLAGAWLLISRALIFIILIITSPVYFLGIAVPGLGQYTQRWLKELISQSLFAPVMMLFMLITITFILEPGGSLRDQIAASSGGHAGVVTLVYFIIVNGMMLGSFIAAKNIGAAGSGVAHKAGSKLKSFALGTVVGGGAGFALTRTVGLASRSIANSSLMKNIESRSPRIGGTLRQIVGYGGQAKFGIAKSNYDEGLKKRQDRQKELLGNLKAPEDKARYLANLNETDRKKAFSELSDREKFDLHSKLPIDNRHKGVVDNLTKGLKGEKQDTFEKLRKEQLRIAEIKAVSENIDKILAGGQGDLEAELHKLTSKEVAGLKKETLTNDRVISHLGGDDLAAIQRENTLSRGDRQIIGQKIQTMGTNSAKSYLGSSPGGIFFRQNANARTNTPPVTPALASKVSNLTSGRLSTDQFRNEISQMSDNEINQMFSNNLLDLNNQQIINNLAHLDLAQLQRVSGNLNAGQKQLLKGVINNNYTSVSQQVYNHVQSW